MEADVSLPERAYYRLLNMLGKEETGKNQGPIVDWAIKSFTKKKADKTGWASWCAGAVCTAYLEAGSAQIKKVASLSAGTLFLNLKELGQVKKRSQSTSTDFQMGDIIFFGDSEENIHHVGLVASYEAQKSIMHTLEGNHNNSVAFAERTEWYAIGTIIF